MFSSILVITLIVRRVDPDGFRFSRISKEWETRRRNVAPSLLAGNIGRGKDWGRPRPTSDKHGSQQQLVYITTKQTRFETNAKNGEMAKPIHDLTSDSLDKGRVNVHIWRGLCCPKVNSLRQYPLFPTLPKKRLLRHSINSGPLGTWYGQRIMGYVHPPHTGNYTFHLDAHVYAEFWLSKKPNTMDVELIAKIAKQNRKKLIAKSVSRDSGKLYLEKGEKYFFDVLHVMNGGMMRRDHVNVTWKVPGSHVFREISRTFLSPLLTDAFSNHDVLTERGDDLLREPRSVIDTETNDADGGEGDEDYEGIAIPEKQNKLSDKFSTYFGEDFDTENRFDRIKFEDLQDNSNEILSVLPICSYEPTYVEKRTFKRFEGVWQTHFSSLFPDDGTKEFICIGNKQRNDCEGNDFLTEAEVLELVQMFTKKIDEKYPR